MAPDLRPRSETADGYDSIKPSFSKSLDKRAMSTPNQNPFSPEEEALRLRARVAELEAEVERTRAFAERLDFELKYQEVFNNVSVCMFLVDVTADGRFRFAGFNPAEEQAVGLTSAEVSGRFVEDVFAADLAQKIIANYRRCLDAGKPIHYDDELDLPGGRRYFHSNLIPMRNATGRIHRVVGACIDTTDFKRTQDEALARQKLESLGVLAGGIAHDFNNLLGSIIAEAELAETEVVDGVAPAEALRIIKGIATRASEIVRELMNYCGHDEAILDSLDLSRLVGEMLELLKLSISRCATFKVDLPKNLPAIRGHASELRRVVMNLITNASEALEGKEGVISIAVTQVPWPERESAKSFPWRLSPFGDQRYWLWHDERDPIQNLRSILHDQIQRARHGARCSGGHCPKTRRHNQRRQYSRPGFPL